MGIHSIFTQHSRSWQSNRYVYPVISRRSKGLSIGINLNPDTACNFDCVYCCVNRTMPPAVRKVDLRIVTEELDDLLNLAISGRLFSQPPLDQTPAQLRKLRDIAFSGNGEPTAYPHFAQACRIAAEALASRGLTDTKIVVITNATLLDRHAVTEALDFLDPHNGEIWAKLDAGTEDYYRTIERTSVPFKKVLDNVRLAGQKRDLVIQSLFLKYQGEVPGPAEIAAYVTRLKELVAAGCRIKLVQVYTVARATAESGCSPLPGPMLDEISRQVREAGLPVETYYGPE